MPEIWVRYETTDIAINIKFENLLTDNLHQTFHC